MRQRSRTSTRRWTRRCPWRSGLLELCGSLANTRQRSDQLTRVLTCRSVTGVPTAPRAGRPTQFTGAQRGRRANRRRHSWADGHFMATFCGRGAVAATQCSKGAIAVSDQEPLVLRADHETSLTTLLDEISARRAETFVERTAVESHQSIGAVERVNHWLVCYERSMRLSKRGSGAKWRWIMNSSAGRFGIRRGSSRVKAHTACELIRQRKYVGAIVVLGGILWATITTTKKRGKLDQRWVEVVRAGKAEGSDEHNGLDLRQEIQSRASRARKQQVEARSDSRGCWMPLGHEASWSHHTA